MTLEHMATLGKLLQVKKMTTQLAACLIIHYFKETYKLIATDLKKQQALDADPKAMQHVNFTGNLNLPWKCNVLYY